MSSVTKVQIGGMMEGVGWIQLFIINFLNLLIYLAVLGLGCGTRYLQSPLQREGSSVVACGIQFPGEGHSVVSNSLQPPGLYSPWTSPGQNPGEGSLSLLQRIFPSQGSKTGLPHCRWILYQLSHRGSPQFPDQGLNLDPLHWEYRVLATGPPGKY